MGMKELFLSGLVDIGSGTVDTVHGLHTRNSREVSSGIAQLLVGAVSSAVGLTVGAVQLGAKAIQAGMENGEEE